MFPLNDTESNRYTGFPFMVMTIICINVLVLVYERIIVTQSMGLFREVVHLYGTTPNLVWTQQGGGALASITSMFLHGGLFHLVGNMTALWVFGRRVEDACGAWRFLLFYLLCGVTADTISTLIQLDSMIPSIGASGAVFGIMGAHLLLFPGSRIRTFVLISFIPTFPRLRAFWVILYFLAIQLIPAYNILVYKSDYRVGYWAHLGGFFSCFFVFLFLRPEAFSRYFSKAPV